MKRRHSLLPASGSTSFITTTVVKFFPLFRHEALAIIVLDNIRIYAQQCHIKIHGFVIMPNHLHLLITAEEQDSGDFSATRSAVNQYSAISQFMGRLKEYSAKEIVNFCLQNKERSLLTIFSTAATESKQGHKYQVWQKRFDNVVITRQADLLIKLNYIHSNPLQERWGLCERIEDYRFSSAKYYITDEDVGIPIVKIT